ncbi:MAG: hypothetical protein U0T73_12360 [Chitinophagales bacterium]
MAQNKTNMIKKLLLPLLFLAGFQITSYAQNNDLEEVVYLKSGNVYRGVIIEQIPNQTVKIKTIGGNIFTVNVADISKITKEPHEMMPPPPPPPPGQMEGRTNEDHYGRMHHRDEFKDQFYGKNKEPKPFYYKRRGYFFQAQLTPELGQMGVRIINGYRAGRFAQFGIGVGIDFVGFTVSDMGLPGMRSGAIYSNYQGVYLPIFLSYTGDILKRRITPFYNLEVGYAFHRNGSSMPFSYNPDADLRNERDRGGVMGGFGIGVKVQSAKRFNFRLSLNWDFKTNAYRYNEVSYDDMGNAYVSGTRRGVDFMAFPGLKLGFGF